MEENPNAGVIDEGSDNEIEYDEDGNPIAPPRRREIEPLPAIDHSEIEYKPFEKNFYTPHEEISNLSRSQVEELRHKLGVKVGLLDFYQFVFIHFLIIFTSYTS